ncbi:MAG TPA: hypothetical protein PLV68_14465, partial [Ilumatobacteraceae bacterium]|nr:hypothetical protein [Ilumatobacteraceae bacterium]
MNVELSRRSVLALGAVPVVAGLPLGSRIAAAASPRPEALNVANASKFVPVPPARLADTREGTGYQRLDANTIRVEVAGLKGMPDNALAAVLNITAVNTNTSGYITVYPTGSIRPVASTLNYQRAGQIIPNLSTVLLGVGGSVDIFCLTPCDVVVDVNGAYVPVFDAVRDGRFVALPTSYRVLDTRDVGVVGAGNTIAVDIGPAGVPASASAVVVNLTVTESRSSGFWTVYPAGTARPGSSSANTDAANQTRANQAILPI